MTAQEDSKIVSDSPALFTPVTLRGVTLKNRIVISPMQQYAAEGDGLPTDYHIAHYGRAAMGGAGLVFTEALCTSPQGRLTYTDLGVWDDGFIAPLARIAANVRALGATPGAQILHAGRKASVQRPCHGFEPLTATDARERGEAPWETVGPSALAANPGWPIPREMTRADIDAALAEHAAAARRCREAGFDVLDVHAAHGYLIHTFLSPISNQRTDGYGGGLEGRIRFALEVAAAVRSEWPDDKPLFYRISVSTTNPAAGPSMSPSFWRRNLDAGAWMSWIAHRVAWVSVAHRWSYPANRVSRYRSPTGSSRTRTSRP